MNKFLLTAAFATLFFAMPTFNAKAENHGHDAVEASAEVVETPAVCVEMNDLGEEVEVECPVEAEGEAAHDEGHATEEAAPAAE